MIAVELDRNAVDRVLRRASELSPGRPGTLGAAGSISEEIVIASAAEVGLDPSAVRLSLAIERLGPPVLTHRTDRLLGAPEVASERVLALAATEAIDRLDELMVHQHQLRTKRTRHNEREWQKRTGAVGAIQRTALAITGDAGLSRVPRVTAVASEVENHRSVVRLIADRRNQRTSLAAGSAAVGSIGLAGVAFVSVIASPLLLLTAPLAVGAAIGVAAQGRKQAATLADELDAVFDAVEQRFAPVTLTDNLRRVARLAGGNELERRRERVRKRARERDVN